MTGATAGVEVLDWSGMEGAPAADAVRRLGLRAGMELICSSAPRGRVVGQQPSAGERVGRGSVVRLLISSGEQGGERQAAGSSEGSGPQEQRGPEPEPPAEQADWEAEAEQAEAEGDWESEPEERGEEPEGEYEDEEYEDEEYEDEECEEEDWETPPAAGQRAQPAVRRIRWMLVLGGRQIGRGEAALAALCVLAVVASIAGLRGIGALALAGCVLGLCAIAASLSERGEGPRQKRIAGRIYMQTHKRRRLRR